MNLTELNQDSRVTKRSYLNHGIPREIPFDTSKGFICVKVSFRLF